MSQNKIFDLDCRQCPRLASFLDELDQQYPDYHNRPVEPFGSKQARLLVVGLAPGMHGANATGRPFTGDHAGILLYETLYKYGFASKAESLSKSDGLKLINCRITNAVKCLPPQNKPIGSEVSNCNAFLASELKTLKKGSIIVALGGVAHKAVVSALGGKQSDYKFGHEHEHKIESWTLIDSYHCSRYNTQTKRLTEKMFHNVFRKAKRLLSS
jgi:uracil-DNA glycosylase family 4